MSLGRALLCVIFPPLAVLDKGCGMALIVGVLWLAGWLPGVIAAIVINLVDSPPPTDVNLHFVEVPIRYDHELSDGKRKRTPAYVRLSDGEIAEIIDDDGLMPDPKKYEPDDSGYS